jgi:hypothetical protein
MQLLQAGKYKMIYLELDPETIINVVRQAGFDGKVSDGRRALTLDLTATGRQAPLLLFDASDPGNLGWFSRCQFYVDGITGGVLQTPLTLANQWDRQGRPEPQSIRLQITRELPPNFRFPGRSPVSEQMVYTVLYNVLNALLNVGVGVCGGDVVKPLAGRTESIGPRN